MDDSRNRTFEEGFEEEQVRYRTLAEGLKFTVHRSIEFCEATYLPDGMVLIRSDDGYLSLDTFENFAEQFECVCEEEYE